MLGDFADGVDPGAAVAEHDALGKTGGAGGVVDGDAGVFVGDRGAGPGDVSGTSGAAEERLVIVDHVGHAGVGDARCCSCGSTSRTLAPQCCRIHSSSAAARRVFSITRMAPIRMGAKWASSAMAPLGASTATRSPATTPELQQGGRLAFHAGGEFGVGEAAVAIHHRYEIAPGAGAAREEIERSERRDHAAIVYHRGISA